MAKKEDLDVDGLDNLDDFDWPEFNFDEPEVKDDRNPIIKGAAKVGQGAVDHFSRPSNIERTVKRVMPSAYGEATGIGFNAVSSLKDVYNTTSSELAETNRELKRVVRQTLPQVKGKVPDKVLKWLERYGGNEEEQYHQARDKERELTANIDSKLDEVLGVQAQERQERDQQGEAEKLINQTRERKRFRSQMGALNAINQNLSLQREYQDKVGSRVARKSLELAYRQTYLLGDIAQMINEGQNKQLEELKFITKNTGLPEAVKISQGEEFKRLNTQRIMNRIGEGLFGETGEYLNRLFTNVSTRARTAVTQQLRSMREQVRGAQSIAGDLEAAGPGAGTDSIIGMGVGLAGDYLVDRYGGKLQDRLKKVGLVNAGQDRLQYGLTNAGRLLNEQAQRRELEDGWKSRLRNLGRGLLERKDLGSSLADGLDENGHMPDNFNRMTNRSLIDIIPGLLARIHNEVLKIRTGEDDAPLIRYNMATGTFTDMRTSMAAVGRRLINQDDAKRSREDTFNVVRKIDSEKALSPKQQEALARHIVQLNMRQLPYDPQSMINWDNYFGGGTEQDRLAVRDFMRKRYELDAEGRLGKNRQADLTEHAQAVNALAQGKYASGVRRQSDPIKQVQELIAQGHREELIALGVIDISRGTPVLNQDRITDLYLGGQLDDLSRSQRSTASRAGGGVRPSLRARVRGTAAEAPAAAPARLPAPSAALPVGPVSIDYERMGRVIAQELNQAKAAGIAGTQEEWMEAIHTAIKQNNVNDRLDLNNLILEEIMQVMTDGRLLAGSFVPSEGQPGVQMPLGKWDQRVARLSNAASAGLQGLRKRMGQGFGLLQTGGNRARQGVFAGAANLRDWWQGKPADMERWFKSQKDRLTDVYVNGVPWAKLEAAKLEAGEYFDAKTGEVLKSLDDIKGPVKDRFGRIVLSFEDLRAGLKDQSGKDIVFGLLGKFKNGVITASQWFGGQAQGLVNRTIVPVAKWLYQKATDLQDIYVKGELEPRLLASLVRAGAYRDRATGQIITKFSDIKGDVEDLNGELVLRLSDMRKGLVNQFGLPIKEGFMQGIQRARGYLGAAQGLVTRQLRKARVSLKRGWRKIKGLFKDVSLDNFGIQFGTDEATQGLLSNQLTVQLQMLEALNEINGKLDKPRRKLGDIDGDGVREGSVQDLLRKRFAANDPRADQGAAGKDSPNAIGALTKAIAGMKAANGDGEGDTTIIGGAGGLWDKAKGLARKGWGKLKGAGKWIAGAGAGLLRSTALRTAGGFLLRTAVTAGLGLAGLMSAPVVAGVTAAAAIGTAGYFAYKYFSKDKVRPLQRMRLAQYGWDLKDENQAKQLVAFEAQLLKGAKFGPQGVQLSLNEAQAKDALGIFGIEATDSPAFTAWQAWYVQRFKPILMNWLNGLNGIAKEVALSEADDRLTAQQQLDLWSAAKGGAGLADAYRVSASPFGEKVVSNTSEVAINRVIDETGETLKQAAKTSGTAVAPTVLATAGAVAATAAVGGTPPPPGSVVGRGPDGPMPGGVGPVAASVVSLTAANDESSRRALGLMPTTTLDALRAVRFRSYGLVHLERNWIRALIELEEAAYKDVVVDGSGTASWKGDLDKLTDRLGAYFGVDAPGGPEWNNFQSWFKARFLPVYLAHVAACKRLSPALQPGYAQQTLSYQDQYELAQATAAALGDYQGSRMSVWSIPLAPSLSLQPNLDRATIADNLKALQQGQDRKRLDEEAGKPGQTKDARRSEQPGFFSAAVDKVKNFFGFKTEEAPKATPPLAPGTQSPFPSAAPRAGAGNTGTGSAGEVPGQEVIIDHPGKGAKGDINSLPFPTATKGFEAHKELLAAVAKMTGVDPGMLASLVGIESGFNSAVKAGTSSAQGLGQFIGSTWKMMLQKYGDQYGIAPGTPSTDPRANALMTALFMRDNAEGIQKVLGNTRKVTDTDVYMAHFLGLGGYSTFLKNPGAVAAGLMPDQARANRPIFFDQSGRPRTTDEIIAFMGQKVAKHREQYGKPMATFAGTYVPTTDAKTPAATADNTNVQGTESPTSGPINADTGLPDADTPSAADAVPPAGAPVPDERRSQMVAAAGGDITAPPSLPDPNAGFAAQAAQATAQQVDRGAQQAAQRDAMDAAQGRVFDEMLEVNRSQLDTQKAMDAKLGEILRVMQSQQAPAAAAPAAQVSGRPVQEANRPAPVGPVNVQKRA